MNWWRSFWQHRKKTVLFFDWDDTLLCSSALFHDPPREELAELDLQVLGLLELAIQVGRVIIVTNADAGWVELSALTYMPEVSAYLRRNRHITIISARASYGHYYPGEPVRWKLNVFQDIMLQHRGRKTMFGSIGDSCVEWTAFHLAIHDQSSSVRTIRVKLVEKPSVAQLVEQIDAVYLLLYKQWTIPSATSLDIVLQLQT
jgi:hypothetical protein